MTNLAPPNTYGSDDQGQICGYLFDADRVGVPIESAAAAEFLALDHGQRQGRFVWLHFNLAHAAALPWLRRHARLDDEFYDASHDGSRSTRIERHGDMLFAVMNDVTFDFSFEASDIATLWVAVYPHFIISARRHPLRAVDRLRAAVKAGEVLDTPLSLLDHLLHDQADELQRIVRTATDRVDLIEDDLLAGHTDRHAGELARLRRLAIRLQRLLAPEPSALNRTIANPPRWLPAADLQRLTQASEDFAVVLRDVGALQERVKLLLDETGARVAVQNNRTLFMLTMVTVLALPINLMAGLLGMNVGGIPLANDPHGFWLVLLVVGVLTVGIAWYSFRRLGPKD